MESGKKRRKIAKINPKSKEKFALSARIIFWLRSFLIFFPSIYVYLTIYFFRPYAGLPDWTEPIYPSIYQSIYHSIYNFLTISLSLGPMLAHLAGVSQAIRTSAALILILLVIVDKSILMFYASI